MDKKQTKKSYLTFFLGLISLIIAFFAICFINISDVKAATSSDVYRFWSDTKQGHFYTASATEKDSIIATYSTDVWKYEGVAFQVYTTQESGTIPVYRFWSDTNQGHFYTASEEEKNYIIATYPENVWKYEGIAWYAYVSQQPDSAPVYRFWSDEKQHHFFTFNPAEKTCVQNSYAQSTWNYEGVAYWTPGTAPPDNPDATCGASLGPLISVGIWSAPRTEVHAEPFKIKSSSPYNIKNSAGTVVAQISANITTKIEYASDGNLNITDSSVDIPILVGSSATFEAQNNDNISMIFSLSRSDFTSANYRGRLTIRYSTASEKVWAINTLPLEQYVWGMAEIKGTGPMEYNKVMTTSFRTYGYFWLYESTKNLPEGFIVDATPGNQLYRGYDYEEAYPRIKEAAQMTRGNILTSSQSAFRDKVAITPYSSWTDGRTRSFQERWGGTSYPWCQSVADPYGKNTTLTTAQLEAAGNHMVGLSANGALKLAGTSYNWTWDKILKYYYTGVALSQIY